MKQFLISRNSKLRKAFDVTDTNGRIRYSAKYTIRSFSEAIEIFDDKLELQAIIKRIINPILPSYKVMITGEEPFTITRKFGFCVEYSVKGLSLTIKTDSRCENYLIDDNNGNTLFVISKAYGDIKDKYVVKNCLSENDLLGICIAFAVEAAVNAIRSVK